jgi:chromosome segregation ATPase
MEDELAALEARVDALIAFTRELQDANDILRRELLALQERNRDLNGRVTQATTRLDALIAKVPHE